MTKVEHLLLRNSRHSPLSIVIEPWGEIHSLGTGAAFEIVATGPAEGLLEAEAFEDRLVVYAWPGSTIQVFQDGKELLRSSGKQPVPPALPGKSIRETVDWMNKKTREK